MDDIDALVVLRPLDFLQPDGERAASCGRAASALFSLGRSLEPERRIGALEALLLSGFDEEQVWQQLELRNKPLLRFAQARARKLPTALQAEEEAEARAAALAEEASEEDEEGEKEDDAEDGEEEDGVL